MAECAIARCVQERRSFKKELQKWGKNVLYLAGLERVAEELVGSEKWNKLMESTLLGDLDLDTHEVVDWEPDEICYFCKSRKQPPLFPVDKDPAKGVCSFESLPASNGSVESDGNLSEDNAQSPSPPPDQPLDLSIGSKHSNSGTYSSPHSPSVDNGETATVLKVPQIPLKPGMKKRLESSGCKRSYTEDELQAALRDIQSGKLGTRRAAVIYGIPRSTLRNKVYKLALERDNRRNSGDSGQNSKEKVALSMEDLVKNSNALESTTSASESLRQLLKNRMAEKFTDNKSSELRESLLSIPSLSQFEYSQALAPILSQVLANVQELALARLRSGDATTNSISSELPDECRLSIIPELIKRLTEERFEEESSSQQQSEVRQSPLQNGVTSSSDVRENASTANKSSTNISGSHNVILKIPSYKPMKTLTNDNQCQGSSSTSQTGSGNGLAGKGIGVSLREIIAKSITQRAAAAAGSTNRTKDKADTCNGVAENSTVADPPSKKKKLTVEQENNKNAALKTEKRTRPKRGRYRNYDRDNLAEAVRAVQRGEMSVHRAGSYYGVPHSTLEYKVKERHLLRPRKRDLKKQNALESANTSSKLHTQHSDSSTNSTSSQNAVKSATLSSSDAKSFSGLAVSFPSHMPMWQSSPFFSFDFNQFSPNHFFASQMMRKLQEDALLHADDSSNSGGKDSVSLLSSIIRSSLQAQAHAEAAIVKATSIGKETLEGSKDGEVVSDTQAD